MKKHLKSVASFVVALGVAVSSAASISAASYSDVPSDASYAEAVSSLSSIGILTGYEEGTFKPDANITRAEVATVVVRALAQESAAISSKGATAFTDVPADHWASGYINVASSGNNAFINGMGDGTFAPDANVTYAQVIKMLVAGIGYGDWGVSYGGYPTGYITAAKNLGITNGVSTVNADEAATRGTVAQLTFNAINTPLLSLETYSPTNPEYVILDGTGDRDYETPLTYYHNIYTVEGRVTATNRSQSGLEAGEVRYQIENTKNYGEDALVIKRADNAFEVFKMYTGDTDAADYLNVYSKALVYVNDDEDATILSIVASGKNQLVELDAKGWDDEEYESTTYAANVAMGEGPDGEKPQIWFYADGSKKGKSTKYYLANMDNGDDLRMYVNGVEVDVTEDNLTTYIFDNEVGKVTLVDTPADGSVSTDGKYDAIFVSYYGTAIVDSTTSDKIYFDSNDTIVGKTDMSFEWDDDDYEYSFIMDGQEIKFEDIKEGDVLSIAFNVEDGFKDSNFYDILVSRKVAEGKVIETNTEDGEIGIGDETYSVVDGLTGSKDATGEWEFSDIELGTSYTVVLDAFNRIVDSEKLASTVKYGIIHRVWYDSNSEEAKVTLYDTSAASKTLIINEDDYKTNGDDFDYDKCAPYVQALIDASYDGKTTDVDYAAVVGNNDASVVENAYEVHERVFTYETNSKGEIKDAEKLKGTGKYGEYKKSTNKIGSLAIGDSTVIISKGDENKTDYNLVNTSALVDGTEYTVFGYDKDGGVFPFILVVDGIGSYNEDTRFAVVEKVTEGTNESDDECNKISLYTSTSKELQIMNTDEKDIQFSSLKKGDVIVFKTNASGEITEVELLFSADSINSYNDFVTDEYNGVWAKDYNKIIDKWDKDDDIEIICGPIIDKSSSSVTIVKKSDIGTYTDEEGDVFADVVEIDSVDDLSYDSDVAIYVYDMNNSKNERLYAGTTSSVVKTNIPKSQKLGANDQFVDLVEADKELDFTIAFAKTVNDDVTDLFIIIPKND